MTDITQEAQTATAVEPKSEGPGEISAEFVLQMEALKTTLEISGSATEAVEQNAKSEFSAFARSVGAKEQFSGQERTFAVPPEHVRVADRIFRQYEILQRGKRTLTSTFLIAAVAEFDVFVARLLRWVWSVKPELFGLDDKQLSMADLRDLGSVREAESILLEREIDELLRASRTDQYAWLEKRLKTELGQSGERWQVFIEAHERRHLCVHAGGRVSAQYLRNSKRVGVADLPEVGQLLEVTPQYFRRVASVFSEMAVLTTQVVWRKLSDAPNSAADESLSNIAFSLLEDGKFRLASTLLDFGLRYVKKISSERVRKVWLINRAQAEKWRGNSSDSKKLIDGEDWSASSPPFRQAVAVLRDDFESAATEMRQMGVAGEIKKHDYEEWPLFREFRKSPAFAGAFRDVFGVDYDGPRIGESKIRFRIEESTSDSGEDEPRA